MEIWDAKGNKVLDSVVTQNAEHVEELMQADYVSLQWVSNVKRVLPAGAYIIPFDDVVRYMLLDPHTPDQNNTDEFTYSPQFQHPKMYLGKVPYTRASKDTEGNDINLLDWEYKGYLTTFLSDLCGFITKTFTDAGITTDKFSYSILGDIEGNITISISNNDILSVLNNVCNTLDCEWHLDWEQRRLFIGNVRFDKNEGETLELTSGVNVGMASVSSQSDTYYNVYLPQGSTRNMAAATSDGSYYATNRRLELDTEKYPDGKIYTDGEGNVVTKEQFLEARLPKLVQTLMLDEIYPKIDLYVYNVRNRERYLLDDNGDKVIDHYEGDTPVYKRYAIWYMRLAYPIYNTDGTIRSWKDATLGDTFKLIDGYTLMCSFGANTDSTLTSPLAGREFELNYVETDNEARELSAKADSDKGDTGVEVKKGDYEIIYTTEGNLIIPTTEEQGLVPKGESSPSKNGNMVTIFNVVMGEDFIKAAQNDLEVAAIREIKKQYSDLNQYTFNSDNVAFKKDMPSLYIGRSVKYNDGVGNTLDTRIMKLTTKLDFPFMVEITVGNKVLKGSTSQLKTDVQMILSGNRQTASNGITESVVRSLIKGFGGANFLSKVNDDTARGIITFLQGTNWGNFTSDTGAAMTVDPTTGQTYMEVDRLKVRLKAFFEQLEVQKVGYVGGKIIVSKGQGVDILDVEEIYDSEGNLSAYRCYFLGEQEGRRINNLLRVDDQMICKDENISEGSTDGATNKYYWRLATAVSSDVVKRGNNVCHWVDLSATDCDTNSDIPEIGDTICHLGNREDTDRQGAEILSVVDANSPSFTIYSGINSYSLVNKEYIDMGVINGKAYCNIYGSTYIGDRERKTGYLRWNDNTKTFEIKGTIDISSPLSSGGTIGGAINNAANAYKDDFSALTNNVDKVIGDFQKQLDGAIETWFYDPEPTLGNLPASEWTDNNTKDKHLGDLYYSGEGKAYRFQKSGDNYVWQIITDTDITKALEEAKKANDAANAAQGTADSKMRVFVVQPTNNDEYSIGDMWVNATYPADGSVYSNEILKCKKGKAAGEAFSISHWEKASKYTDDTAAKAAQTTANAAAAAAKNIDDAILAIDNNVNVALKDKIITKTEAAAITEALNSLSAIMADVTKTYAELVNNDVYKLIADNVRTSYKNAYDKLVATFNALSDYITNTLTKANPITAEILSTYNTHYTNFKTDYEAYVSKLNVVRNSMDALLNTRIGDIASMLGGLKATKDAMDETTQINGGLILSTLLALGYTDSGNNFNVMSGVSGLYESDTEKGNGIAFWAGGHRIDINDCTKNEDGTYSYGGKVVNPADFLVRHDGTGYAAGGALWWEKDGKIHADPQSFLINEQYVGNVMQLFKFVYSGGTAFENIVHAIPQKPFESLSVGANGLTLYNGENTAKLYIKNGVLFIEGDLAVTGGITMYASDGVKSGMIDQVYAVLDQSLFSIKDGVITITGEIGGGTVKAVKIGSTQYDPDSDGIISLPDYPTVTTLEWDNILNKPSSFTPSAHTHAISEVTNLQATLDGKAAASHTHAIADITNLSSASVNYATSAGNADTLDGNHASAFALSGHTHSYLPLSGGSMSGTIDCQSLSSTASAIKFRGGGVWDSGIGHDTAGNETLFLWAKTSVTRLRWHAGIDFSTFSAGSVMNITPDFEISKASGSAVGYIAGQTIIHSGNISSQSVNYASSSGNADTVDGYHASSFAFQGAHNNLMAAGNEFTFASSGYSGGVYINYRTAGGTNGNITDYILYNGSGGRLGNIIHTGNYSSYCAPASHTHSYLPLSGGTMSGNIDIQNMDIIGYGGARILQNLSGNLGINPSGNVGIGTTIPGYKLTVSGTLGVTGSVTFSGLEEGSSDCTDNTEILTSYASNNGFADSNAPGVVHRRDALCMYNYVRSKFLGQGGTFSGTVGFSSSTYFGSVLYIQGNQINLNTNSAILYNPSTTPAGFTMPSNDCDVLICTRLPSGGDEGGVVVGSDVCVIYNSADEGAILKVIDKDVNSDLSQSYTGSSCYLWVGQDKWCRAKYLYASGDILAGGGITMYSDLRKKNILSDEVLSVKEIAAAPLFRHTYKSDDNQYIHVGTSAQYWSGIHEDWFTRKDSEGYYQMELQNLGVAMGISLAREIVKYESKTDKKIRLMRKKINDLEARIKELEGSREERRTA